MISPSPTQQPPMPPAPEERQPRSTPARRRTGEAPAALFVKGLFRPIFKALYFVIKGIRTHKLLTLLMIVLLLASVTLTTKLTTGEFPFGIGSDPFNFHTNNNLSGGDHVKNWLYALRDGNVSELSLLNGELIMSQPPDPNQLISQFSQTQAHLTWKSINQVGAYSESDSTLDSFIEVDVSTHGPGGSLSGIMVWHFVTFQGRLLIIDLVGGGLRAPVA